MLETRVWAALFVVLALIVITYILVRVAGSKKGRAGRDRFWRPIAVIAELSSALGVIAVIALTAQYFVRQESDLLREEVLQAAAKRQGHAFIVELSACRYPSSQSASFREMSEMSVLCEISKNMDNSISAPLDEASSVLGRIGQLPGDMRDVLSAQVAELEQSLQVEIEARKRLHLNGLQAVARPGESAVLILAIAVGVFLGACLKFSRALSEWIHRRDEG